MCSLNSYSGVLLLIGILCQVFKYTVSQNPGLSRYPDHKLGYPQPGYPSTFNRGGYQPKQANVQQYAPLPPRGHANNPQPTPLKPGNPGTTSSTSGSRFALDPVRTARRYPIGYPARGGYAYHRGHMSRYSPPPAPFMSSYRPLPLPPQPTKSLSSAVYPTTKAHQQIYKPRSAVTSSQLFHALNSVMPQNKGGLVRATSSRFALDHPIRPTTIYSPASRARFPPRPPPTKMQPARGYPGQPSNHALPPPPPARYYHQAPYNNVNYKSNVRAPIVPGYQIGTPSYKYSVRATAASPQKLVVVSSRIPQVQTKPLTTTTSTIAPTVATTVPPFPAELMCTMQSECEMGCCYTNKGAILWDQEPNPNGTTGYCHTKAVTKAGDSCHPMFCPCQASQSCISVPPENTTPPPPGSEPPEGGYFGNPKCYTSTQELKIKEWLNKLDSIVMSCRYDLSCPLGQQLVL